ncbi:MAG TPA: hypothetical protein PKM59_01985 [Thermodesulfobacteriota bacterium]|nr:hypothetical protein [Thermodesulfobacteriota bacterium]HNU70583.1 hypothetical protein [Thermodesulfobacteriota bacterium]
MPRGAAPNIQNELRINDSVSGDVITLFYRIPTTEERVAYQKAMFARKRNKVETHIPETRQKYGKKILTGFKEGDFYKLDGDKKVFFSSDPASPNYDPDWMNLICTYAMDLLEFMALQVFEGNTRDSNVFADEEEEEAGEIIDPND